jgi:DnaJ-domain-containing protein 1
VGVTQAVTIFGTLNLLLLVRSTRALQDCSDRVLAEPDMAADQPVAQTSLCQLEDLLRLAVRWTLSWLAAEPLTAGLGGGDAGLDAFADKAIAAHIDATRSVERYGVASIEEMFAGFLALPAPGKAAHWRQVLGVENGANLSEVEKRYRELARRRHPDQGGSDTPMAELNQAITAARAELGLRTEKS